MATVSHRTNLAILVIAPTILGGIVGWWARPEDWGLIRAVIAGLFAGACCGSLLIASRWLGAFKEPEDGDL